MKKLILISLLTIIMLLGVHAVDYSAAWPSSSVNSQYNYNDGFMNHMSCLGYDTPVNVALVEESGTKYINIEGAEFTLTSSEKSYIDSDDVKSIKSWFEEPVYFWIYQSANSIEIGCTSKDYSSIAMNSGAQFALQNRIAGGVDKSRYDLPFIVRDLNDASKRVDETGTKTVEILPSGTTEESVASSQPVVVEPTTPVSEEVESEEEPATQEVEETGSTPLEEESTTQELEEIESTPVEEEPTNPETEEPVVVLVKEDPVTPPQEESEPVVVTQALDEETDTDQDVIENEQETTPEQEVEPVVANVDQEQAETEGKGVIAFVEDNFGGIIEKLPGEKTETKAYIFLAIVAVVLYFLLFRK